MRSEVLTADAIGEKRALGQVCSLSRVPDGAVLLRDSVAMDQSAAARHAIPHLGRDRCDTLSRQLGRREGRCTGGYSRH